MDRPTERFSSRVENYIKYRPGYPPDVLRILRDECGLTPDWRIADVGSGTGILTEVFLKNGNSVFGVEPNAPMREAAERLLQRYPLFTSIDGSAEETGLADSCVEMVTAGQAFHWFDGTKAKPEFTRILKPGGWVVLLWNGWKAESSAFLDAWEQMLLKHAPEYQQVNHRRIDDRILAEFFSPRPFQSRVFPNTQVFDFEGLKGRLLSSSYAPLPGQPGYEPMITELREVFERCNADGKVYFEYDTQVYFGQLKD